MLVGESLSDPVADCRRLLTSQAIVQIRYGGFDNGTRRELVLPAGAIAYAESLESFLRNHPRTAELVDDALDGRSVRLRVLPNLPAFPAVAEPVHAPAFPPASPPPKHPPAPASPPLVPTEISHTPPLTSVFFTIKMSQDNSQGITAEDVRNQYVTVSCCPSKWTS